MQVPLPYRQNELYPVRTLTAWTAAAKIDEKPVIRRIWLSRQPTNGEAPFPLSGRIGGAAPTFIARIIKCFRVAADLDACDCSGHSLSCGALTSGMLAVAHLAQLRAYGDTGFRHIQR